jgi:hypothetical protein
VFDDYGLYNSTTATFTVPVPGLYQINLAICYNQTASNMTFAAGIFKNGTGIKTTAITSQGYAEIQSSFIDRLAAADTLVTETFCSAASITAGRGANETMLSIVYLGTG